MLEKFNYSQKLLTLKFKNKIVKKELLSKTFT